MKKLIFIAALLVSNFAISQNYDYKIVTSVESVVPGGLGRSRIIENGGNVDYTQFTTTRSKDGKEKTSKDRSEVKIDDLKESTLVNFYSLVGINFQNIASNDAMMTSLLRKYNMTKAVLRFMGVLTKEFDIVEFFCTKFPIYFNLENISRRC